MLIVGYSRPRGWLTPSLVGTPTTYFNSSQSETSDRDITHTSLTGNVLVRMLARTNSTTHPAPTATWNGTPLTQIALERPSVATSGSSFLWGGIIRAGSTGAQTLRITRNTSMGRYVVVVDDLDNLPASYLGDADTARVVSAANTLDVTSTPTGYLSLLVGWGGTVTSTDSANPVTVADWTTGHTLNGDVVPDTSAHTRAVFVSRAGGAIASPLTATYALSGGQTSALLIGAVVELKGVSG